MARPSLKVWDPFVRAAHWTLVASVIAAWVTQEGGAAWHERFGYVALAVVALRLPWGWLGPRYARFAQFVHRPSETIAYAKLAARGAEPRHLGHNPLGGWMIVALLASVAAASLTGWLYTTDEYWGVEWVEDLHEASANVLVALVLLHVAGVIVACLRHREDLVGAMVHGRKRPPGESDVV